MIVTQTGDVIPHRPNNWTDKSHDQTPGIGNCQIRTRHHNHRMGHMFVCRETVGKVTTMHCSWCWAEEY